MTLDLTSLQSMPLPAGVKGLPPQATGLALGAVGRQGWNVLAGDLPLPVCVIRQSAIDHNRAVMADFVARHGFDLAPHGKTTMAPQLFAQQLADGAWAITAATPAHLALYRSVGVSRIIYANQLIDDVALTFAMTERQRDAEFELICIVDSTEGVRRLAGAVARNSADRPLDVLIELGIAGRRTGVRTREQAIDLVDAIAAHAPFLNLRGVEAFEGIVPIDETGMAAVDALVDRLIDAIDLCPVERPILSVGGSAFVQRVAARIAASGIKAQIVLRSGCYLVNDHGMYAAAQTLDASSGAALSAPLRGALEVWGHVQSRPEPDLVVVAIGKRDISHDIELPKPLIWSSRDGSLADFTNARVIGLNDQHAMLAIPPDHPIAIGDRVALGCSHPCTTFDKWRLLSVVDDRYNVIDAIATFF